MKPSPAKTDPFHDMRRKGPFDLLCILRAAIWTAINTRLLPFFSEFFHEILDFKCFNLHLDRPVDESSPSTGEIKLNLKRTAAQVKRVKD